MPIDVHLVIDHQEITLQRGAFPTVVDVCSTSTPTWVWYTQFPANYFQPGTHDFILYYTARGKVITYPAGPLYWDVNLVVF